MYLKSSLGNLKLDLLECLHVLVFNEFVPVHSASLMEQQSDGVHGRLDRVRRGEEDALLTLKTSSYMQSSVHDDIRDDRPEIYLRGL